MSPRRFILRMVAMGAVLAVFQIAGMELLVFYITNPTWSQLFQMLNIPGPMSAALLAVFFGCAYLYLRPVLAFLAGRQPARARPVPVALLVHQQALDEPEGELPVGVQVVPRAFALPFELPEEAPHGFAGDLRFRARPAHPIFSRISVSSKPETQRLSLMIIVG